MSDPKQPIIDPVPDAEPIPLEEPPAPEGEPEPGHGPDQAPEEFPVEEPGRSDPPDML